MSVNLTINLTLCKVCRLCNRFPVYGAWSNGDQSDRVVPDFDPALFRLYVPPMNDNVLRRLGFQRSYTRLA